MTIQRALQLYGDKQVAEALVKKRTIVFDAPSHTYKDEDNCNYISVTTVIKIVENEFNADYWAWKKSRDLVGVTPEQLKKQWVKTAKDACDKGNIVHDEIDKSVSSLYRGSTNLNPVYNNSIIVTRTIHDLDKWTLKTSHYNIYCKLRDYIEDGWVIYSEKRVYNNYYKVAGTIDCILVKNGKFKIFDWKTNKDPVLKFVSGYFKKDRFGNKTNVWVNKGDKLKAPLGHLEDCKGIKYTLQLSMYAFLTEMFGLECVGLELCHIKCTMDATTKQVTILGYEWHTIDYKQKEIRALLDYHVSKRETKVIKSNIKFEI